MIKILKVKDAKRIRIITNDDEIIEGLVDFIDGPEDASDLEPAEYDIVLKTSSGYVCIYESEIKNIEVLD